VFSPADFADIAGAITVRKILTRSVDKGTIRRLMFGELASPDPEAIAQTQVNRELTALCMQMECCLRSLT
jgi:hypothetical protein